MFALLVAEMAVFMLLIVPLPYTWKRALFTFISESPIVAKLQYGMKVQTAHDQSGSHRQLMRADYVHLHPDPFY